MQITLFHLPNSRSQRILWLLEELNCEYKLVLEHSVHDSLNVKYPTIDIVDQGVTIRLSETSALAEFLYLHFDGNIAQPTEISRSANYFFWKNYPDGSFMPDLALKQIFNQIVKQTPWPLRFITKAIQYAFSRRYLNDSLKKHMDKVEQYLIGRTWIDEQFGICDILLWFPLQASYASSPQGEYPNIDKYLKRIAKRTAFKVALKKGQFSEENFQDYWR